MKMFQCNEYSVSIVDTDGFSTRASVATGSFNLSWWKARSVYPACTVNSVHVDDFAMQGARASAAMILTQFSQNCSIR